MKSLAYFSLCAVTVKASITPEQQLLQEQFFSSNKPLSYENDAEMIEKYLKIFGEDIDLESLENSSVFDSSGKFDGEIDQIADPSINIRSRRQANRFDVNSMFPGLPFQARRQAQRLANQSIRAVVTAYFRTIKKIYMGERKDYDKLKQTADPESQSFKDSHQKIQLLEQEFRYGQFLWSAAKNNLLPEDNFAFKISVLKKTVEKNAGAVFDIEKLSDGNSNDLSRDAGGLTCAGGQGCFIPTSWQDIYGYGCYCNFQSEITKGFGHPVDEHDAACQEMQLCTRCLEINLEDNNDNCDLASTDYQTNPLFNQQTQKFTSNCAADNAGNDCAIGLCECHMEFLNNIASITGATSSLVFKHDNNFDRFDQNNCPRTFNAKPAGQGCCGESPAWRPYNPFVNDCCSGTIEEFGSCPNENL